MLYREFKNMDLKGRNAWYRECQRQGRPTIQVLHRTKWSKVDWDYISISAKKDNVLFAPNRKEELTQSLWEIYLRHSNKRSCHNFTVPVGEFDYMTPEAACAAAEEVASVFEAALR